MQIHDNLLRAKSMLDNEQYDDALRLFKKLKKSVQSVATKASICSWIGSCYFFLDSHSKAIKAFEQYMKLFDANSTSELRALDSISVEFYLSVCYDQIGKASKALSLYLDIIEQLPQYPVTEHLDIKINTRICLARLYADKEQESAAIGEYAQAELELNNISKSDGREYYESIVAFDKGMYLLSLENFSESEKNLRRVTSDHLAENQRPDYAYGLMSLAIQFEDNERVIDIYESDLKEIELWAKTSDVYHTVAHAYFLLKRFEESKKYATLATERSPFNSWVKKKNKHLLKLLSQTKV